MGIIDASICAQTMVLAAEAEGLGSCYNGNILNVMDQISDLMELPEQIFPVVMLTLGWPRTDRRRQGAGQNAADTRGINNDPPLRGRIAAAEAVCRRRGFRLGVL